MSCWVTRNRNDVNYAPRLYPGWPTTYLEPPASSLPGWRKGCYSFRRQHLRCFFRAGVLRRSLPSFAYDSSAADPLENGMTILVHNDNRSRILYSEDISGLPVPSTLAHSETKMTKILLRSILGVFFHVRYLTPIKLSSVRIRMLSI